MKARAEQIVPETERGRKALYRAHHAAHAQHIEPRPNLKTAVAYRVRTKNGTLVLCTIHLDKLRSKEAAVKYTGDTFAVELCDHCHPSKS